MSIDHESLTITCALMAHGLTEFRSVPEGVKNKILGHGIPVPQNFAIKMDPREYVLYGRSIKVEDLASFLALTMTENQAIENRVGMSILIIGDGEFPKSIPPNCGKKRFTVADQMNILKSVMTNLHGIDEVPVAKINESSRPPTTISPTSPKIPDVTQSTSTQPTPSRPLTTISLRPPTASKIPDITQSTSTQPTPPRPSTTISLRPPVPKTSDDIQLPPAPKIPTQSASITSEDIQLLTIPRNDISIANNIIEYFQERGKYPHDGRGDNDMCNLLAKLRSKDADDYPMLVEIRNYIEQSTLYCIRGGYDLTRSGLPDRKMICDIVVKHIDEVGCYPPRNFKITDDFTAGRLYTKLFDGNGIPLLRNAIEARTMTRLINTKGDFMWIKPAEKRPRDDIDLVE